MTRGFTIIEVVIVLALLSIVSLGAIIFTRSFSSHQDVSAIAEVIASAINQAETQARGVVGDSPWGIKIFTGEIVVFKGISYAARDINSDFRHNIGNGIVVTGATEVVFSKLYGYPNISGNIIITAGQDNKTISLNAKGVVTK